MDNTLAMVIDDSRAMRGILKRILLPLGFEVRKAANGKDALDQTWDGDLKPAPALIDWEGDRGQAHLSGPRPAGRCRARRDCVISDVGPKGTALGPIGDGRTPGAELPCDT